MVEEQQFVWLCLAVASFPAGAMRTTPWLVRDAIQSRNLGKCATVLGAKYLVGTHVGQTGSKNRFRHSHLVAILIYQSFEQGDDAAVRGCFVDIGTPLSACRQSRRWWWSGMLKTNTRSRFRGTNEPLAPMTVSHSDHA